MVLKHTYIGLSYGLRFVTVLFDMVLKHSLNIRRIRDSFVTVLFDMVLKLRGRLTFKVHGFVTVLFDMVLKHKLYIMHLLGVFLFYGKSLLFLGCYFFMCLLY